LPHLNHRADGRGGGPPAWAQARWGPCPGHHGGPAGRRRAEGPWGRPPWGRDLAAHIAEAADALFHPPPLWEVNPLGSCQEGGRHGKLCIRSKFSHPPQKFSGIPARPNSSGSVREVQMCWLPPGTAPRAQPGLGGRVGVVAPLPRPEAPMATDLTRCHPLYRVTCQHHIITSVRALLFRHCLR